MILACHNLKKAFGEHIIVNNGSFHIEDKEKAALIGVNGAGKSTVLKMITRDEPSDDGQIILTKGKSIGYLAQQQHLLNGSTIYEEVRSSLKDIFDMEDQIRSIEKEMKSLSGYVLEEKLNTYHRLVSEFERRNGYACESEITGVLKGLGFTESDFTKKTDTLSGGEKTRVSLGKLLLTKPDILLLDEPTNHLDINSVTWLETYLLNYPGAVLVVSHDRFFLNRIVTKVIEIEYGKIEVYTGNYKQYAEKKRQIRDARMKEYLNRQREIKHQEAVIEKLRSFNREKSIRRAESREKLLNRMQPIEKPADTPEEIHFSLEPSCTSGNDVLRLEQLQKSFGDKLLFDNVNMEIKRGEHVAIIGDNGTGKTTLLKILNGIIEADKGEMTLGAKVHIGYYDQEYHVLNNSNSIFDEISNAYPALTNTQIRNTLAAFQFTGDDVFKQIGDLSGGEKGRVSLAKLMLSEANFLILDEPTNHLDITSKEILEQALNDYTGTVLYVSHDRYFINQTATRIVELVNHTFVNYIGNYDYYLEKREIITAAYCSPASTCVSSSPFSKAAQNTSAKSSKLSWQEQKEQQAKERKRKNELKKTEERIAALEERNKEIDQLLTQENVYSNSVKCQELTTEKTENETELTELYEQWESLAE